MEISIVLKEERSSLQSLGEECFRAGKMSKEF